MAITILIQRIKRPRNPEYRDKSRMEWSENKDVRRDVMYRWIYYRIYANPNDSQWYYKLINQVVIPLFDKHKQNIEKIFFFHYYPKYDKKEKCEERFNTTEPVAFIRLRLLIKPEKRGDVKNTLIEDVENTLIEFINEAKIVIGKEKYQYNFEEDLGGRFGSERKEIALDYLDAASRLMMELVRKRNEHQEPEKAVAALHLSANTFDFHGAVDVRIGDKVFTFKI